MDSSFKDNEKLYRAVRPIDMFWRADGTISSAALRDSNGLSVDRGADRSDAEAIAHMKSNGFKGTVISLQVSNCKDVGAVVKYLPSTNIYHSEIHGSETKKLLSDSQRKKLSNLANIEGQLD